MQKEKEYLLEKLERKGFSKPILDAFASVQRENFVPEPFSVYAYDDIALPIEEGATLSQPSTTALMLSLLELKTGQCILEIGSGSGYVLALISHVIREGRIYGIEINHNLAVNSKKLLSEDKNIEILNRSGFPGLPEHAPFDRMLISASADSKEVLHSLLPQLNDGGILVAPVKSSIFQIIKRKDSVEEKEFQGFAFVPLRKEE